MREAKTALQRLEIGKYSDFLSVPATTRLLSGKDYLSPSLCNIPNSQPPSVIRIRYNN